MVSLNMSNDVWFMRLSDGLCLQVIVLESYFLLVLYVKI